MKSDVPDHDILDVLACRQHFAVKFELDILQHGTASTGAFDRGVVPVRAREGDGRQSRTAVNFALDKDVVLSRIKCGQQISEAGNHDGGIV